MSLQTWNAAERSGAVLDGEDLNLIAADTVDHAVALHEHLVDVYEFVLGHDAPTARDKGQSIRRLKHLLGQADGLPRGPSSNVETDLFQQVERGYGPGYDSHWAIRWRASPCDTF